MRAKNNLKLCHSISNSTMSFVKALQATLFVPDIVGSEDMSDSYEKFSGFPGRIREVKIAFLQ
jgi:hypothetical protein